MSDVTLDALSEEKRTAIIAAYTGARNVWKAAQQVSLTPRLVYRLLRASKLCPRIAVLEKPLPGPTRAVTMGVDAAHQWLERLLSSRRPIREFAQIHQVQPRRLIDAFRYHFPEDWEMIVNTRMPNATRYKRGKAVEDAVRDDLIARGYAHVHRSHRSWGQVDLYAFKPGRVLFVQVKAAFDIGVDEWNDLLVLATASGAEPVIAGIRAEAVEYHRITRPRVAREGAGVLNWEPLSVSPGTG